MTKREAGSEAGLVCLVLGGNGFIGSHIVDKLSARVKKVKVIDPFFSEPKFDARKNIERISADAYDEHVLSAALKDVQYVLCALASTNPFTADKDPYADIEGLRKIVKVFEVCAKMGVKKVGFISSGGAVYGSVAEHQTARETGRVLPVSPYGIGKLATEYYLGYFRRKYGMEYVVFRLSNPYGPRQAFNREQGVIPAFLSSVNNNETIVVQGDGTASRDYIYVEDAAEMMTRLLIADTVHHTYNIGSGVQTTLNQIITFIEEALGKEPNIEYIAAPPTALLRTAISVDRALKECDTFNITPFPKGMSTTIEYFLNSGSSKRNVGKAR